MSDTLISDETLQAAIRRALKSVKEGNAFVEGNLSEDDFVKLTQRRDDATVDLFFHFVAKQVGTVLSPQKKNKTTKSVLEMLQSQREKWIKEIQQYSSEPQETPFVAEQKPASAITEAKPETDTPAKPKAVTDSTESVLVTGDVSSTNVVGTQEAVDMDVDEPVKVASQKPTSEANHDSTSDAEANDEKEATDADTKKVVESAAADDDGEKKPADDKTEEMDVDEELDTKEAKQHGDKKRKAESEEDKKAPRKKPRATKKAASAKKKKIPKERIRRKELSGAKLEEAREIVKKEEERDKAEILDEIPEDYKKRWGQVGFAKWGKGPWLPCLFVGPFDLGATSAVKEEWMRMYNNTRGRRHQMTVLVYWYGTENLDQAFSFVAQKDTKSYEKGAEMYGKIPAKIQKKLDTGKKLTKSENELVRGLEDLAADLLKQPQERLQFEWETEAYMIDDYVRTFVDPKDLADDLLSSSDDEELMSSDSSSLASDSDDDDAVSPPTKKKKKPAKKLKQPAPQIENEDMSFAEDDISSADDSKDEEVKLSDEGESDDDENDKDYLGGEKKPKKKSAKVSKRKSKEERSIDRKRSKTPKEKKEPTKLTLTRRENKTFSQNEDAFLPILKRWNSAILDKDTVSLQGLLKDLLGKVDSMGAPFIEEYGISPLLKQTKSVFKEKNVDTAICKALNKKLGDLYAAKKALVPKDYKPKKRKPDKKVKKDRTSNRPPAPKPKREDTETADQSSLGRHLSTGSMPGSLPSSQSSAEPGTPVRRVLSQGSSPRPTDSRSRGVSPKLGPKKAAKPTSQKSEKTSFSLNSLFNKPSSSQPESGGETSAAESKQSGPKGPGKSLPTWMTSVPSSDVAKLPSERVDRLLALEFFQGAAARFPKDKVNRDAIARALEAAVYQWSLEQYKKEDTYWPKVHAIVAGVCGKRKPGTLVAAIMAGEYESARDVITLSDELLKRDLA